MCGIIGIVGKAPVSERLIDSLKRLEYRGYDSAGVAAVVGGPNGGKVERRRAQGKIKNLEALLAEQPLGGQNGIGHVRWATHGAPNLKNAHPQTAGRVTLVHNGIIENFAELKAELAKQGGENIIMVVGGVIPPQDFQALLDAGAASIFPPGTVIAEAAIEVLEKLNVLLGYSQGAAA